MIRRRRTKPPSSGQSKPHAERLTQLLCHVAAPKLPDDPALAADALRRRRNARRRRAKATAASMARAGEAMACRPPARLVEQYARMWHEVRRRGGWLRARRGLSAKRRREWDRVVERMEVRG